MFKNEWLECENEECMVWVSMVEKGVMAWSNVVGV